MDCERVRDGMALRVTGPLPPSEEEGLSRHLAECDGCRIESARLKRLVSVLASFPEEESRPATPAKRKPPIWLAVAAAALFALGVSLAAPRWGDRPTLEGDFVQGADGTWTASSGSSAVDLAGHRGLCRKGTRFRIAGAKEIELDSGRLDVTGKGGTFRVGTPLGRVDVLGTDFTVEVMPVKKIGTLGGGFLVGVFVSSGVVSYGDLRLERGQAAVAETGKSPRKVQARELDYRLKTAQDAGRDFERKLAALDLEKARLAADLDAARSGKPAPAPVKLAPADRRERFRRLARFWAADQLREPSRIPDEEETPDATAKERSGMDQKLMAEAVAAANELGVPLFSPSSVLFHREFAQELLMQVLDGKDGSENVHRALVEAAVQQAYEPLQETYEFRFEKTLAALQAFARTIDRLESSLPAKAMETVTHLASAFIGSVALPSFSAEAGKTFTTEGVASTYSSLLARNLGLEEHQVPILQAAVNEWIPPVMTDLYPDKVGEREMLRYTLRARERTVELARRLVAKFPDKREKIESLFAW